MATTQPPSIMRMLPVAWLFAIVAPLCAGNTIDGPCIPTRSDDLIHVVQGECTAPFCEFDIDLVYVVGESGCTAVCCNRYPGTGRTNEACAQFCATFDANFDPDLPVDADDAIGSVSDLEGSSEDDYTTSFEPASAPEEGSASDGSRDDDNTGSEADAVGSAGSSSVPAFTPSVPSIETGTSGAIPMYINGLRIALATAALAAFV